MEESSPTRGLRRVLTQCTILAVIALILIWDLRKVKQLSDTIHDDHKEIWVKMNNASLDKWYSPYDICLLEESAKLGAHSSIYLANQSCANVVHMRNHLPAFCSIGSSLGSKCSVSPDRSYFRGQLKDHDLSNPNNLHLLRLMKRLANLNKPLVFIGDTISRQNFNALLCEILRSKQVVMFSPSTVVANNISSSGSDSGSTFFNASFKFRGSSGQVSVYFMHLAHVFTRSISTASQRDRAYDRDPRFHPEYSDARIWDSKSNPNVSSTFRHHKRQSFSGEEIRTSMKLTEICSHLNDLIGRFHGMVVIANVGVWYNTRERFRNEIIPFIQVLSLFGRENVVFYRESSAQHWNHTLHGYFLNGGLPDEGSCQPLGDSSPQLDWRNKEIRLAVDSLEDPSTVRIVSFRDLTAPLHDMHPNSEHATRDCTRFCYFPQMWQSIWRDLNVVCSNSTKLLQRASFVNISSVLGKYPD